MRSDIFADTQETRRELLLDWYKTLYKANNKINIKPIDSTNEMMISPLRMPKEYKECKKWFKGIHFRRNTLN